MHSKRTLIRVLTRILYGGGFVFLISGLLLSALSSSALAAGVPSLDLAQATTSLTPQNCDCITPTPVSTKPAATKTRPPGTKVPTRSPRDFNLSSICGYTFDTYVLWKVANNTGDDERYVWRVVGSDESGSGRVPARGSDYFKTSPGIKTVRLFVGDQEVDSETCLAPCKKELQLSYVCTEEGLTWRANNPNSFGVDYSVKVDGKSAGKGMIPANSVINIANTSAGAHTVELTWTDTRPEPHTVSLSSPENSCVGNRTPTVTETQPSITLTPTQTLTPPLVILTVTPTPTETETPPVDITLTPTPTVTETPPSEVTLTPTPTVTETPPSEITLTPTPTVTLTPPLVILTVTPTPTVTQTQPSDNTVTPTPTITLTPQPGFLFTPTPTRTATPLVTLPPPSGTVTSTPVLIPVTGADMTGPIGANSLSLFGSLLTNVGLFTLGLALALTAISSQMKD